MNAELIQTILAAATIVVTLDFLRLYLKPSERWWRSAFGWSLTLMAFSIGLTSAATVLFRMLGVYPGRDALLIIGALVTLIAMTMRDSVLRKAQKHDKSLDPTA